MQDINNLLSTKFSEKSSSLFPLNKLNSPSEILSNE